MRARKVDYQPRLVDAQLTRLLSGIGAVVLEGPKACGKTTSAMRASGSVVRLDQAATLRTAGLADPHLLLEGITPRLIDEWQLVPDVWNAVRAAVDDRCVPGQFILTGSATPADDQTRHSGAMRFVRLAMRPMSLAESGLSTADVSLDALWQGQTPVASLESAPIADVAEAACRGGWPGLIEVPLDICLELNRSYLRTVAAADVVTLDGIRRDPLKVGALLRTLGRNTGTYVSNRRLQTDSAFFGERIDPTTIASYLDALIRLWVLVEQPAWGGHLRSSAPARRAAKRHLVDPSLAVAAMDADPDALMVDRATFGQVFETLVFRDLTVYAQAIGLGVNSFMDARNREIDAVLVKGTRWAGLEVKLTPDAATIEDAARGLVAIAGTMRTAPQFLAVITATGPTYTRSDGVHVLSITRLGP